MNAIGYSRVSTDEQATEGYSLEVQDEKNRQYIELQDWLFCGNYVDPGYSGKNLNRPSIQKVLTEIREKRVQAVVIHKLDRLTRNIGDLNDMVNMFQKFGVKLVSITENIDTSTAHGRMFIFMLGIFAQWYRENLSEEVRKGAAKRADKGFLSVSVPMYGYKFDENTKLVINEDEAVWVRWIFDQYIGGKGSSSIAKELNDLGVRRSQGALWDQHKVMLTLNNVTYTGKTHWKAANEPESSRIVRQGQHEAIISTETFNKAQRILTRRREGLISLNSYEYVFGGIIKCAKCGGSFSGKYNKRNLLDGSPALYRGYVCSNNEKRGTCDQSGISEANVTKLLFERFNSLEELNQFFTHFKNDDVKAINDNRKELEKQIQQSEARRKRWQLAYGDGNMPYEDFSARMAEEVVKMKEWHIQLDQFPPIVSEVTPQEAFESIKDIRDNWQYFEQSTKKQIIQALFQKIAINKIDGKWQIESLVLA